MTPRGADDLFAGMMEGVDAVGDAVTGGAVARAVEPAAGEPQGTCETCLNCGTGLVGEYCHACGQQGHVHRTLGAFGHDLLHSVLHFDGKFWRTLPLLAWRPGELTRRYIEGERARFVSPMALFLFSVFMMFAVFSAIGGPFVTDVEDGRGAGTVQVRADAQDELDRERRRNMAKLAALEAERGRLATEGRPTAALDAQIRDARMQIDQEERLFRAIGTIGPGNATSPDGNIVLLSGADSLNDWFNRAYRKARENPSLLFYKIQANAYKFSWALIPISVPFLWLLFLHRRRYRAYRAYDHVVFVTYSIAFMSLALVALTLLGTVGLGDGLALLAVALIPPLHMYRQLRGAYLLSRWSALWRTLALLFFAAVAGGLFFALLLALGLLG